MGLEGGALVVLGAMDLQVKERVETGQADLHCVDADDKRVVVGDGKGDVSLWNRTDNGNTHNSSVLIGF